MRNVVCWDPAEVRQIINPFAEHMPDAMFRAVHTDWDLKVSPPIGTTFQDLVASPSSYVETAPTAFIEDFMREDRPHALAVAIGTTGSGKSHLIHWMRLNLKEDDKHMVLVVRKSGTSLRAIVEMIIDRLPPEEQQGFRDTLNRAGEGTVMRGGQKQQLLNDIAHAIREAAVKESENTAEFEAELILRLPDIFQDPYMREAHFLKDDTVVADIVDHIFAPSNASDRPDRRRSFEEEDLPMGGLDFARASKNARDALNVVDLEPKVTRPMAVRIINRNLDRATSRTLSFSGDRVEELMGRLRTHLKSQGRELLLLVEEFARLQGIDRALLQAITNQGDGSYCKMRSAIAVTTGFFESVAETAYMRTTHIIDMDRSAGRHQSNSVTHEALGDFTVRYLNAVRLGRSEIEKWSATAEPGDAPPSRCSTCTYRKECHPAFGEIEGYGLYPFTLTALWNASSRVHRSRPESLNPRILQNEVLAEVLDNNEPAIRTGRYPSSQFVDKLGGTASLDVSARSQLKGANADAAERLIPFLELYDGSGFIRNLPAELRNAFGIPEIPTSLGTKHDEPADPRPDDVQEKKPTKDDDDAIAINSWIRGEGLDQNVAQSLREAIFAAVSENIDWDMLGLSRTAFAGQSRVFAQRTSINFERQTTQISVYARLKLTIPGSVDPDKAGQALIGLLRASKRQFRWNFEQGSEMFSAFLDCLEVWTRDVETQLREISGAKAEWDAPAAALELLCVGAAVLGKIRHDSRAGDMIDAALSQWPSECQSEAPEMRALYDRLLGKREKLVELVRAHISSMKGGQVGAMIEPRKAIGPIRNFRQKKWQLLMAPPSDEKGDYAILAKAYGEAKASLVGAIDAELGLRREWLRDMDEMFGETQTRSTIVVAARNLKDVASSAGLAGGGNANAYASAIEMFESVQFDDAVAAARALVGFGTPSESLPYLGRGRRGAVTAGRELKKTANAFLQNVETNLRSFSAQFRSEHGAVEESIQSVDLSLTTIQDSLAELKPVSEDEPHVA
jgi:energy-coupling factor transporter ATP-binding protein EcfA2